MTKIIGVIQVKGGVGRSTVATNIAGAMKGKVALIDCDMPQGTSASWTAIREQQGRTGNLTTKTATNHKQLVEGVLRPNRRNLSNRVTGNICLSNSVQRGRFWVSLRLKSCTENAVGLLVHAETVPSMFSVTQILTGGQIPPVCGYNPVFH